MNNTNDIDKWINLSVIHEKEISELQGKVAALKAEVERLTETLKGERFVHLQNTTMWKDSCEDLRAQRDALKAENERLRSAGDALVKHIWWDEPPSREIMKAAQDWRAAKEGGAK